MRFPLPELRPIRFTKYKDKKPEADCDPKKSYSRSNYYDNGVCACCGKNNVNTCRVEGMPNLCEYCYNWMRKYDYQKDPYRLTRLKKDEPVDIELVKKAVRYAKTEAIGGGLVGMSTGALLLAAYKKYKEALAQGMDEEEARQLQMQAEAEEELRLAKLRQEEEARRQKQTELARKIAENQRMINARQERINRLNESMSAKNIERRKKEAQTLDEFTKLVMPSVKKQDEKYHDILENVTAKCLDMYMIMRYGGLLQLEGLMYAEIEQKENELPKLQEICKKGILEPKEWQEIEKEVMEYKKTLSLTDVGEVIFVLYANAFHMIQDGVTIEEMMEFLLKFTPDGREEQLKERCQRGQMLWKSAPYADVLMEKAREQCHRRRNNLLNKWEDEKANEELRDGIRAGKRIMARFDRQFPRPLIGDFEMGLGVVDFFPDEVLKETIKEMGFGNLTKALILADDTVLERFFWQTAMDVEIYLAEKWISHIDMYADEDCVAAMGQFLDRFYRKCEAAGFTSL